MFVASVLVGCAVVVVGLWWGCDLLHVVGIGILQATHSMSKKEVDVGEALTDEVLLLREAVALQHCFKEAQLLQQASLAVNMKQ